MGTTDIIIFSHNDQLVTSGYAEYIHCLVQPGTTYVKKCLLTNDLQPPLGHSPSAPKLQVHLARLLVATLKIWIAMTSAV